MGLAPGEGRGTEQPAEGDLSCDVVLTKSSAGPWEALKLGWFSGAGGVATRVWTIIPLH